MSCYLVALRMVFFFFSFLKEKKVVMAVRMGRTLRHPPPSVTSAWTGYERVGADPGAHFSVVYFISLNCVKI